jgi:uncharacterized lipoprotein YmbA
MKKSWVAMLVVLSGCASSPPLRYYTLNDVPGATSSSGPSAIRVGRVKIPGELDRSELVQRIDANRLKIAEQDRWAAPLDEMIRRALTADLQSRTHESSDAAATLAVDIDEFIGDATCAVTLRASWELKPMGANAAPAGSGHESIQIAAPSATICTVGALPAAMSQALAQLSERILAARTD